MEFLLGVLVIGFLVTPVVAIVALVKAKKAERAAETLRFYVDQLERHIDRARKRIIDGEHNACSLNKELDEIRHFLGTAPVAPNSLVREAEETPAEASMVLPKVGAIEIEEIIPVSQRTPPPIPKPEVSAPPILPRDLPPIKHDLGEEDSAPPIETEQSKTEPSPPVAQNAWETPEKEPEAPHGQSALFSIANKIKTRTWTWEELLGTQVFLKVGVTVIVLGIVLFLGYAFARMGPIGKISIGYAVSLGMMGAGFLGEKRPSYQTFGRAILAGGWGVFYFVTYAMHFVPASRVLDSTLWAIIALLVAACAAVGFSLRYRHEWTTTFAFLLIFFSLALAAWEVQAAFNLIATTIVGLGVSYLAWQKNWNRLLLIGCSATWLCLSLYLALELNRSFQNISLIPTLLSLVIAFLTFESAILFWRQERIEPWHSLTTIVAFLGALLAGLSMLEQIAPEGSFVWALVLGLIGIGSCFPLAKSPNRVLYLVTATLALGSLALVSPLRLGLGHHWTPALRLLGLEALLVIGILLRERYFRLLALAGLILTFLEVLVLRGFLDIVHVDTLVDPRILLFSLSILCALVNTVLSRTKWRPYLGKQELFFLAQGMSTVAVVLMATLIWLEVANPWKGPCLATLALLWHEGALRWQKTDLLWQSIFLFGNAVISLAVGGLEAQNHLESLALAWITLCAYAAYLRPPKSSTNPSTIFCLVSGLGMFLILAVREVPEPWLAPALAVAALAHLLFALRAQLKDLFLGAAVLFMAGFVAIAGSSWGLDERFGPLSLRVVSSLLTMIPVFGAYAACLARSITKNDLAYPARILGSVLSWAGLVVFVALCWRDLPSFWLSPTLAALMCLYLGLADKINNRDFLYQGLAVFLPAFVAVVFVGFSLSGPGHFIPLRSESLGLVVALVMTCHVQMIRGQQVFRTLTESMDPALVNWAQNGLVFSATILLAVLVKIEALVYEKNLLVALIWMVLGIVYLEISRVFKRVDWFTLAHGLLLSGLVHTLFVNVLQEGTIGFVSLRVLTTVPVLAILVYAYLTFDTSVSSLPHTPRGVRGKPVYLYFGALILALACAYEFHRAWVIVAWSVISFASMALTERFRNPHFRAVALGLAVAILVRVVAINFHSHDLFLDWRLNLVCVPLAIALMLGCYMLEFRAERTHGAPMILRHIKRPFWLISLLFLATGFIWYETTGTTFTIWLSLEGLAVVVLGFLFKDRYARWSGLSLLMFCVLKLFIFDLRGLSGLPRIFSFIVLGVVMIAVSYGYTRFKDRLDKLL